MHLTFLGQEYESVIGSDLDRDGMYLEVTEGTEIGPRVLEIFYSDISDNMTVTADRPDIPLELVEWAIETAKARLIPIEKARRE